MIAMKTPLRMRSMNEYRGRSTFRIESEFCARDAISCWTGSFGTFSQSALILAPHRVSQRTVARHIPDSQPGPFPIPGRNAPGKFVAAECAGCVECGRAPRNFFTIAPHDISNGQRERP